MSPDIQSYVLPLFAAAFGMLALTAPAWRSRREPVVALFIAMCVLSSLWPMAVGLELVIPAMEWKVPLARVRPVLIVLSLSALALLIVQFTGRLAGHRRQIWWVLAAGVACIAVLSAAPPELGWFHHGFEVSGRAPYRLQWQPGFMEGVYLGYLFSLTVAALGLLVQSMQGRGFAYRRSAQIVLAGTSLPLLLNALAKLNLTDWAGINLAPLGILGPAAAWAVALYRYGMLNLIPLGRATVLETMQDMVFILDSRGFLADCNASALAALGAVAKLSEPWATVLRDRATTQFAHAGRTYGITRTPVLDASRHEAGAVVMLHDVTEWIQARERLQESHRLEMVGRLAGGMAHEYNNLLTVILGYTAIIRESGQPGEGVLPLVEHIEEAGHKAAKLTSQMLSFSRRQMLQPVRLRIGDVVEGLAGLLRHVLGHRIELILAPEPALELVKVDRQQLELLLVELAINARDAQPRGGELEIRTAPCGAHVLLAVRDSGEGMAAETLEHIYEPFFTTRGSATHTGLGLSMVHGFVAQSGGRMEVQSELGQGTEIRVFLPIAG